jgi:hypothetical protein
MKKTRALAAVLLCVFLLSACSLGGPKNQTTQNGEPKELQQNDYRGSVFRTQALQKSILAVIEEMKGNNQILRQSSPDAYWTKDGYQDFVLSFLADPIINDTIAFNEEQSTEDKGGFNDIITYVKGNENTFTRLNDDGKRVLKSGYTAMEIIKNEKDDYSITGITRRYNTHAAEQDTAITESYRILYDCDKDWAKAYATASFSTLELPDITTDLFEYRRIDENRFLIQTSTERLYVVLAPAAEGAESIPKRSIQEFAYSRLTDGHRTTFEPYTRLPETDENGWTVEANKQKNRAFEQFPDINETGDVSFAYGKNDSLFLKKSLANTDPLGWVFEDKALTQGIVYEDGILVVVTFNKLSESYERFVFAKGSFDEARVELIASRIEIEGLVGFNEAGEPEATPTVTPEPTGEPEPTETPGETDVTPTPEPTAPPEDTTPTETPGEEG